MIIIGAETLTFNDFVPVLVQVLATTAIIFGGAGFWEYIKAKHQAKREDKKEEKNYDAKFDQLSGQVTGLSSQLTGVVTDVQGIKQDMALLQEASRITAEYRKDRDEQDRISATERAAVIESLKALIRDRLLDAYERCTTKGYYTLEERETYGKLYECYHSEPFEGNGVMQQLRERMLELPMSESEIVHSNKSSKRSKRELA